MANDVIIAIRRAVPADAGVVQALLGRAPSLGEEQATYVLTENDGPVGAIDLQRAGQRLTVEALAVAKAHRRHGYGTDLVDFAESIARGMKLKELALGTQVPAGPLFERAGFEGSVKALKTYRHLEAMGVPLWRHGNGPFGRVLLYRGVWTGLAIIVAMGSISLAVFGRGKPDWTTFVVPAVVCTAGMVFAAWQLGLMFLAAVRRPAYGAVAIAAIAAAAMGIGYAAVEKAVPQLAEFYDIWRGDQEYNDWNIEPGPEGTSVLFAGPMGFGASAALIRFLDDNPSIRTVVLHSPGGRSGEGMLMFAHFRKRRLDTHVHRECSSACTAAFLGGVRRSISQQGRMGFHQGGFPGMNATELREANLQFENFMVRRAGVTREFAERASQVLFDRIWFPTHDELKAARVINIVTP